MWILIRCLYTLCVIEQRIVNDLFVITGYLMRFGFVFSVGLFLSKMGAGDQTCNDIDSTWWPGVVVETRLWDQSGFDYALSNHLWDWTLCFQCIFPGIYFSPDVCLHPDEYSQLCLSAMDSSFKSCNTCMANITGAIPVDIVTGAPIYLFSSFQNVYRIWRPMILSIMDNQASFEVSPYVSNELRSYIIATESRLCIYNLYTTLHALAQSGSIPNCNTDPFGTCLSYTSVSNALGTFTTCTGGTALDVTSMLRVQI